MKIEVFEQEEVNSMPSEDFVMKDDQNKTLHKVLSSPVIGMLPELDEVKRVEEAVNQLIEQVSMKVNKNCPLFSFEPRLSGSLSEGTKCGFPNEFDFLCTMVELSNLFLDPVVDSSPPMFGQLELKPDFFSFLQSLSLHRNLEGALQWDTFWAWSS